MTDLPGPTDESRSREALIEKVAEAIRQSAVMKMEEGEDLALYVAKIWRTYACAALATIEASRSQTVAEVEAREQLDFHFDDAVAAEQIVDAYRDAIENRVRAEQQAEVAAPDFEQLLRELYDYTRGIESSMSGLMVSRGLKFPEYSEGLGKRVREALGVAVGEAAVLEPFERTLGSTRNEIPTTEGGSR